MIVTHAWRVMRSNSSSTQAHACVRIYLIMRIAGLTNDQVMHTVNASQELKTHWDAGFLMGCDSIDHMSREAVALGCELECRETRL